MSLDYGSSLPETRPGDYTPDDPPRRPSRPGDTCLYCEQETDACECTRPVPMPIVRRPRVEPRFVVVDPPRDVAPVALAHGVAGELLRLGTLVERLTLRVLALETTLRSRSAHVGNVATDAPRASAHSNDSGNQTPTPTAQSVRSEGGRT